MKKIHIVCILVLILAACGAPQSTPAPQVVNVYAPPEMQAWLTDLYTCAGDQSIGLRLVDLPSDADIRLTLSPAPEAGFAYPLGNEDLLVVTHPQAGISALTKEQARALFSGRVINWAEVGGNDQPVQVWAYAPGNEVQKLFYGAIMDGSPLTSQARLAASPQEMSDSVGAGAGSVGILTRHWKTGNTDDVLVAATVPALAVTPIQPENEIMSLLACLQK